MQQDEAFNLLKMGGNIFLTGAAGSGKTYLLNQYISHLKHHNVPVAVTASTGIASTHLQGTTIHAWSGIGVRDHITTKELEKLLTKKRIRQNYKKAKVLIIDEISMLHPFQLDMVDSIARYILDCDKAFGGIQIVLCGDFFQLPPVFSSHMLKDKKFAFEACAWEKGHFQVCYLHEQHRQDNDPLLNVLNDIRSGTAGEHTKVPLRTRYKKEPLGSVKATKLYSRNVNVDAINGRELANIFGPEKIFQMTTEGFSGLVEGLQRNCLAPETLKLKVGAEVMFIKNDPLGRYCNGTRCIVTGFDEKEDWPIVKKYDGKTMAVYPVEWDYKDNGITRATITQIPLRLAWAITIHKSQGMTLDAAEIDLGDAFEPGMGYVALSRVRSLDGLKLMNLNELSLQVHPDILKHDHVFKACSLKLVNYLKTISDEEMSHCHRQILIDRFEGCHTNEANKKILLK
jgi:ATP-dependent DNA helicase PIF1